MTSRMRDLFVELRTFECKKEWGTELGIGRELFRKFHPITVFVIALTRVEGGWVVKLDVRFD
jgi:hypothetical protein